MTPSLLRHRGPGASEAALPSVEPLLWTLGCSTSSFRFFLVIPSSCRRLAGVARRQLRATAGRRRCATVKPADAIAPQKIEKVEHW
jgi:hypothetical protein